MAKPTETRLGESQETSKRELQLVEVPHSASGQHGVGKGSGG